MNKFIRNFLLVGVVGVGSLSLGGCTMLQSFVSGATGSWWGRTTDDDYDTTKIEPVYCYRGLAKPDCYPQPLPASSRRQLIGQQAPYKSAKQLAAEKEAADQEQNPDGTARSGDAKR